MNEVVEAGSDEDVVSEDDEDGERLDVHHRRGLGDFDGNSHRREP